jgi:hypothetical protein
MVYNSDSIFQVNNLYDKCILMFLNLIHKQNEIERFVCSCSFIQTMAFGKIGKPTRSRGCCVEEVVLRKAKQTKHCLLEEKKVKMRKFLSLVPCFLFLFLFLSCISKISSLSIKNSQVVTFFLRLAACQLQGTASAPDISDASTTTAAAFDSQQQYHSNELITGGEIEKQNQHELTTTTAAVSSSKFIQSHHFPNQNQFIQAKTTLICPNGLQDGNYIFRSSSSSEEDWSFCGVSGAGFHEFHFQIKNCECFAEGSGVRVCASTAPSSIEPTFISSPKTLGSLVL